MTINKTTIKEFTLVTLGAIVIATISMFVLFANAVFTYWIDLPGILQ